MGQAPDPGLAPALAKALGHGDAAVKQRDEAAERARERAPLAKSRSGHRKQQAAFLREALGRRDEAEADAGTSAPPAEAPQSPGARGRSRFDRLKS